MDPTMIDWGTLINAGGVVSVLVINFYLLAKGEMISKKVHDLIIDGRKAETELLATSMADKICDKIQDAVRDGYLEAHAKINGGGS